MRKLVFIVAWLVEDPEAYRGVTDADVGKGLMEKVQDALRDSSGTMEWSRL